MIEKDILTKMTDIENWLTVNISDIIKIYNYYAKDLKTSPMEINLMQINEFNIPNGKCSYIDSVKIDISKTLYNNEFEHSKFRIIFKGRSKYGLKFSIKFDQNNSVIDKYLMIIVNSQDDTHEVHADDNELNLYTTIMINDFYNIRRYVMMGYEVTENDLRDRVLGYKE